MKISFKNLFLAVMILKISISGSAYTENRKKQIDKPALYRQLNISMRDSVRIFQDEPEDNDYSINVAGTLFLNGLTMKAAWKEENIKFEEEPEIHEAAWATSLNLDKLIEAYVPLTFSFGQIKAAGSTSKFQRPFFSNTASAFSTPSLNAAGMKINLPTGNDYKKPLAGALDFNYHLKNSIVNRIGLSFLMNENEENIFSAILAVGNSSRGLLSFSYTVGNFYAGTQTSGWFCNHTMIPESRLFCQNLQASFTSRHFLSQISTGIFESPHDTREKFKYSFSCENSIKLNNCRINFSAYSASSPSIINSSGSIIKTVSLFKINPYFILYTPKNSARIKTGLCFMLEDKIQEDGDPKFFAKALIGTEIRTKNTTEFISFQISDIEPESPYTSSLIPATYTASARFSVNKTPLPSISCSCSIAPDAYTATYRSSAQVKFPTTRGTIFFLKSSFYLKTKENDPLSGNAEITAELKLNKKKLRTSTAFSIKYVYI